MYYRVRLKRKVRSLKISTFVDCHTESVMYLSAHHIYAKTLKEPNCMLLKKHQRIVQNGHASLWAFFFCVTLKVTNSPLYLCSMPTERTYFFDDILQLIVSASSQRTGYDRPHFCANLISSQRKFSDSLPRLDKSHKTSQISTRTEQTFVNC